MTTTVHVLLVEDDVGVRDVWRTYLEREGYHVTAVATGEAALRAIYLAFPAFDVLVLDLVLPGLMGRDLLDRARRQLDRRTPVIAVSGRGWARDAVRPDGRSSGLRVLAKPLDLDLLGRAVKEAVALGRSWREQRAAEDERLVLEARLAELVDQVVDLHHEALADPLTRLPNRRALRLDVEDYLDGLADRTAGLALVLIDADGFSRFNRTGGYRGGDRVIRSVAQGLWGSLRDGDRLYRFGGDEFVVLAECGGVDEATALAQRLRQQVAKLPLGFGVDERVTLSAGVAVIPADAACRFEQVFDEANQALRRAKELGGDRVVPTTAAAPLALHA